MVRNPGVHPHPHTHTHTHRTLFAEGLSAQLRGIVHEDNQLVGGRLQAGRKHPRKLIVPADMLTEQLAVQPDL
jgi:hypothetical protein